MREILFRGKRKICDEWVYGFPFISRKGEYKIKWYDGYYGSSKTSEIYPESIGQFTGLTDKNGKKIFEGDIVKTLKTNYTPPREYRKPFQVHYNSKFPNAVEEYYSPFEHFTEKVEYEVIGNIHDNPELLETP